VRPALLALLSALAVAWYRPALLTRLTAHGVSARLGLTAWLTVTLLLGLMPVLAAAFGAALTAPGIITG